MLKKIIKKLNLDNEFVVKPKKQKVFNKVKNNVPPIKNFNFQSDLLFLPTTKKKNKYLLVVVDLANNAFDIEPLQDKTAESTLEAFKKIIKRKYLKLPYISMRTDDGGEFQGVFNKFLEDNAIYHSISQPYRHKQLANINILCRQLGVLFNLYMNTQEIKTDKEYTNWDDIIDEVRVELNNQRIIQLPDKNDFSWLKNIEFIDKNYKNPKFKIGDVVHKALDYPRSALNKNQTTKAFREGDLRFDPTPRKIKQLIYMPDRPYIRYILDDKTNVSYPENELMLSKEKEEKYEVDRIINEKSINKKKYLLIKWKGYKIDQATWEPYDIVKKDLGEVVFNELYNDFKKK
jgi:hypothetical protein